MLQKIRALNIICENFAEVDKQISGSIGVVIGKMNYNNPIKLLRTREGYYALRGIR